MRFLAYALSLVITFATGPAYALCSGGTTLTATRLQNLLAGHYAFGGTLPNKWNELYSGGASGNIDDYKLGPSHATDPSDGIGGGLSGHHTGTYAISGSTTGTVVFTYGSSGTSYTVMTGGTVNGTGSCTSGTCTLSQTYAFCGPTSIILTVSATHG